MNTGASNKKTDFIARLLAGGVPMQATTDSATLRDLSGSTNLPHLIEKANDIFVGKYDHQLVFSPILFFIPWWKKCPREMQIVGKVLRKDYSDGNIHVVVYDNDFRNSLEIRKANGEKICIEDPTENDELEHHFFAWDEINRRWEGVK